MKEVSCVQTGGILYGKLPMRWDNDRIELVKDLAEVWKGRVLLGYQWDCEAGVRLLSLEGHRHVGKLHNVREGVDGAGRVRSF